MIPLSFKSDIASPRFSPLPRFSGSFASQHISRFQIPLFLSSSSSKHSVWMGGSSGFFIILLLVFYLFFSLPECMPHDASCVDVVSSVSCHAFSPS